MKVRHLLLGLLASSPVSLVAANIDRSTLTEVVNNVRIIEPTTKRTTPAVVKAEFLAPNVLRTGPDSRAEMVAPDQTVTRVGQNTVFSFSRDSREIELQQGSILFQSPTGKGGGTIRTPAASAAVLGTTLIVCATKNGGFKVLLVEGSGRVKGAGGVVRNLSSGEMVYALPGGRLSGIFTYRLSQQVGASALIGGYKKKLPSAGKIQAAVSKQEKEIAQGRALDTGLLASGSPTFAYQVDVARDTIVEEQGAETLATTGPTRFQNATASDAVVLTSTLDPARVFAPDDLDPVEFPGDSTPFFGVGGDSLVVRRASNPAQFIGTNIIFDTPSIALDSFTNRDVVQFLALQNIKLNRSLDLGTFSEPIQLWAGGTIETQAGTPVLLSANTPQLVLAAFGDSFAPDRALPSSFAEISTQVPLVLSSFSAQNMGGSLGLAGGHVELLGTRLLAQTELRLAAVEDLLVTGVLSGVAAPPVAAATNLPEQAFALLAGDLVDVRAGGNLTLIGGGITSRRIQINGNRDTSMRLVQLNDLTKTPSPAAGPGAPFPKVPGVTVSTRAALELRQVNLLSNSVVMQARTVILSDVQFRAGSRVILESNVGRLASNPNTSAPPVPGFVNFIKGVRYGSSPAEGAVVQDGPGPTPAGSGIIIRPRK